MPPDYAVKKIHSRLSNAQHKEICEYTKARPAARHQDIADEFMRKYSTLKLDRSTITKTLQKSEQYLYLEESP
ncbi:10974_t:CDS:1, partial [Gigaspora rosea]